MEPAVVDWMVVCVVVFLWVVGSKNISKIKNRVKLLFVLVIS